MPEVVDTVTIFISYAHEEDEERAILTANLRRIPGVEVWDDRAIPLGSEWDDVIHDRLKSADIILLLVSVYFLDSKYVKDVEIEIARQRHVAGTAIIIPVLVRKCLWEQDLGMYQALPSDEKLADGDNWLLSNAWPSIHEACTHVAKGVQKRVEQFRKERQQRLEWEKEAGDSYRKKVAELFADGSLSDLDRDTLNELLAELPLSAEDAVRIEQSELRPQQEKLRNLRNYEKSLRREIGKEGPSLSPTTEADLTRRREDLLLTIEEVEPILQKVLEEWEAGALEEAAAAEAESDAADEAAAAEAERVAADKAAAEAARVAADEAAAAEAARVAADEAAAAEAARVAADEAAAAEAARVAAAGSLGGLRPRSEFNHGASIVHIACSSDGSTIASVGSDDRVVIWAVHSGQAVTDWTIPSRGLDVALDADGGLAAVATAFCAWVYDTATGDIRSVLQPNKEKKSAVSALALTAAGTLVAGNMAGTVQVWRPGDWGHIALLKERRSGGPITCMACLRIGTQVFLGGAGEVSAWESSTGGLRSFPMGEETADVTDIASSADGRFVAVGVMSGALFLVDTQSGLVARQIGVPGSVRSCSVSPDDGAVVVAGSDGELHVWTVDGELVPVDLDIHGVVEVHFMPNGHLVTAGADGVVRVWTKPESV